MKIVIKVDGVPLRTEGLNKLEILAVNEVEREMPIVEEELPEFISKRLEEIK